MRNADFALCKHERGRSIHLLPLLSLFFYRYPITPGAGRWAMPLHSASGFFFFFFSLLQHCNTDKTSHSIHPRSLFLLSVFGNYMDFFRPHIDGVCFGFMK